MPFSLLVDNVSKEYAAPIFMVGLTEHIEPLAISPACLNSHLIYFDPEAAASLSQCNLIAQLQDCPMS